MYGGSYHGGYNPDPQYLGQCIMGENGYPLIAARVHHQHYTDVQWRKAEVECGLAMDGGLQDVVLHAAFKATQDIIYVDDAIFVAKDHMGAINTALEGAFPNRKFQIKSLKELNGQQPPDGVVVIHLATQANSANHVLVAGQPTKTALFFQLKSAIDARSPGYSWPSMSSRGISPTYRSRSRSRY